MMLQIGYRAFWGPSVRPGNWEGSYYGCISYYSWDSFRSSCSRRCQPLCHFFVVTSFVAHDGRHLDDIKSALYRFHRDFLHCFNLPCLPNPIKAIDTPTSFLHVVVQHKA